MTQKQKEVAALIQEIRTAFNQLKSVAEAMHADLEVNPSMRAVLQSLVQKAPQTVPEIAKAKSVSRQHVQKIANELLAADLIRVENNPDHKRSVHYRPTPAGERLFATVQAREAAPMAALTDALSDQDTASATHLLAHLNATLKTLIKEGK